MRAPLLCGLGPQTCTSVPPQAACTLNAKLHVACGLPGNRSAQTPLPLNSHPCSWALWAQPVSCHADTRRAGQLAVLGRWVGAPWPAPQRFVEPGLCAPCVGAVGHYLLSSGVPPVCGSPLAPFPPSRLQAAQRRAAFPGPAELLGVRRRGCYTMVSGPAPKSRGGRIERPPLCRTHPCGP